ncbi:ATP-dependent DNA helicase pfh1-like [Rhizophagus clarus]|uniref:ATP-dependent DNA helicase n=1 Tax=Rhizophagus clarus TaxID=94130 RepID=A0A8H3KTG1_9GLOM|nr:ATP-dependent DNA helicase pfh1-like [Rhizophagus clarus]
MPAPTDQGKNRSFVSLNLNKQAPRWIHGRGNSDNSEGFNTINDVGRMAQSPLKSYWNRPEEFEECSLFKLYLIYKLFNGNWKKCDKENIQLKGDNFTSWSTLYSQYIGIINSEPVDLLGLPVDNEENETTDDESLEELSEDDESEEYRYDWMHLAEIGLRANIDSSTDLGTRDMDINYDWINEGRQRYSDDDLTGASDFIRNALDKDQKNNDRCDDRDLVDFQTLNVKQNSVLKQIKLHYNDILMGKEVEALRMIIMEIADTGKSYLIGAIREKLWTMASNKLEIDGERLKQLQERLQGVHYVIIDKLSMVGRRMLAKIDTRLRQGFSENRNVPFGKRSIILFSNFGQLPPVLDLLMYTTNTSRDASSNNGIVLYKSFLEACKLDVIERQNGDSEEQRTFRDILL